MRRTAAVLATALLAGAAALTAPAAHAATAAQNCSVTNVVYGATGTCTGMDPNQTWSVGGWCQAWENGFPVTKPLFGATIAGDGTVGASCVMGGTVAFAQIVLGPTPPAGPTGRITGYADKCVDVKGASNANSTPVQIWDCTGGVGQQWKVATDGTVRALGKCLDVQGGNTGNATRVQLYDCNGTGAQQWQARSDGSLLNPRSGRCLDDLGFSTANGNQLGIWDCNGAANQVWHLPV
ncbi:ricin-type beta-trefoil lectin domain protein [Kitasatospora purpeofusca]|uniref:ricin-type beta-trefoil lectin domain protein n=1 Tax=Kitasatospora purpeofusca TaxID=67352 RepID=UPI0036ECA114